jgi:hypothetical protein
MGTFLILSGISYYPCAPMKAEHERDHAFRVLVRAAMDVNVAIHAQDVRAKQAVRKADAREAARAGENPLLGTWKLRKPLLPVPCVLIDVVFSDGNQFALNKWRRWILVLGDFAIISLRGCLKCPGRSRLTVRGLGSAPAVWKLEWRNMVG